RVFGGERRQRFVQGDPLVGVGLRGRQAVGVEGRALAPAAALLGLLPPGGLDEDAAHGLSRGGEEVAAALPPRGVRRADQPHVGFVDEGGGVKRVAGGLVGHAGGGEPAQLV